MAASATASRAVGAGVVATVTHPAAAIANDAAPAMAITGLSMAAHATPVVDRAEAEKALRLMPLKYPPQTKLPFAMPGPDDVRIFRVTPVVISVLDYSKGFGHADLVTC